MTILKSPPKPPKNETLQIRIEEQIKSKLEKYAEFIQASEAYVITEALKLIFHKDHEFKAWIDSRSNNGNEPVEIGDSLFEIARRGVHDQRDNAVQNAPTREKETAAVATSGGHKSRVQLPDV
jgi:hypothetical protein